MKETIRALLAHMTMEEKLCLLVGNDYWHTLPLEQLGLPSIMLSDGPHGLRKQDTNANALGLGGSVRAVCFPTASGTAASFNRDMLYRLGATLGAECRKENVSVALGPAVNIKRSPLCGRNFEYFSEDPYLSAEMAVAYTQGMQSKGVGVSIKHFAANNQEKRRMTVRSVVDERAMREIYFPAFEQTVKRADPWTVMCAYNRLYEGIYCSENKRLLTDILRKEWGFKGLVVSDWGAVSNRANAITAGLDLEMPGSGELQMGRLRAALDSGELEEADIDACCERVIKLVLRAMEAAQTVECPPSDWAQDHETARAFARESMVLLKNEGVLPLKKDQKAAFLGGFAKKPRYQGGGSSHVNPFQVVSALEAAGQQGLPVEYAEGFGVTDYEYNPVLAKQAIELAKSSEVAVIFAGLSESMDSEGADRRHIDLPPCQAELIREVAKVQPNLVVVLHNGAPVRMPWVDDAAAILESYLAGETVGAAQIDLLYGDYSPSAKLAETFPLRLEDTPCYDNFPGNPLTVEYRESIFVGYRYYDKADKDVLFPFGHGLTYSSFAYSDLRLSAEEIGPSDSLTVTLNVQNTGEYDAAEVVQIYLTPPEGEVFRAVKELVGFEKVFLAPGETRQVEITLDPRAFAYYHTGLADWYSESGEYRVVAAASSRDLRLSAAVRLQNDAVVPSPYAGLALPNYQSGDVQQIEAAEFEALLGFALPPTHHPEGGHRMDWDSTLEDAQNTRIGRVIACLVNKALPLAERVIGDLGSVDAILAGAMEMPLRSMASWSQGVVTAPMTDALCNLFNGEKRVASVITLLKGGLCAVKKLWK